MDDTMPRPAPRAARCTGAVEGGRVLAERKTTGLEGGWDLAKLGGVIRATVSTEPSFQVNED